MNIKTIGLIFSFTLCSLMYAGPGTGHSHSHEPKKVVAPVGIPEEGAKIVALNCAYILADVAKIDEEWKKAKLLKLEKIKAGNSFQWKASFSAENLKDVKKSTLYIFMQADGKYVAGNFTGK